TPTVVAGDKSLVNLIAHELAHSWSGNLVTNATWEDLWLNEGFTSYVENRIMEEVFGRERAVMEQALDTAGLKKQLKNIPAPDTRLNLKLNGRDPDDAFSSVPYTKGQLFLL
ncbi:M1 family aminopeptidase, partial [Pseudoalteromonas ruthenica]